MFVLFELHKVLRQVQVFILFYSHLDLFSDEH